MSQSRKVVLIGLCTALQMNINGIENRANYLKQNVVSQLDLSAELAALRQTEQDLRREIDALPEEPAEPNAEPSAPDASDTPAVEDLTPGESAPVDMPDVPLPPVSEDSGDVSAGVSDPAPDSAAPVVDETAPDTEASEG